VSRTGKPRLIVKRDDSLTRQLRCEMRRMRICEGSLEAASTKTFFGSQPRNAHVPPNGRLSTIATAQPALRHFDATVCADAPDPITRDRTSRSSEQPLNDSRFERRRQFLVKRRAQRARGTANRLQLPPKCAATATHREM
jgi:hypothetical protein